MTSSAAAKPAGVQLLRISNARVWAYGGALVAIGLCTALIAYTWQTDWIILRTAGALAGTKELLEPNKYSTPFVYPPAVAWLFVPASHLPLVLGFYLNAVFMLAVCALAAIVAARIYGLSVMFALLLVFAWVPATQAGFLGQFTPVALALSMAAILGIVNQNYVLAGASIGLLLYKPPDATAFVLLLLVRREWRALAIVAVMAVGWYVASAIAAGSDWQWPTLYFQVIRHYYGADFATNALKVISLPGVLMRLGVSAGVATSFGAAILLLAAPRFARSSPLAAGSAAPLVSVAASPHAFMYDAAVVIPTLLYAVTAMPEPWRSRLVGAAYVVAPLWVLGPWIRFDPLAIVVLGGALIWLTPQALRSRWSGRSSA